MTTNEETKNQADETSTLPPHRVFVGSDVDRLEDELKRNDDGRVKLPPRPEGILPYTEEEKKEYTYPLETLGNSQTTRLKYKLFGVWNLWGAMRINTRLEDIVNNIPDDKGSDEFYLREFAVLVIDKLGKILNGGTDILEDFTMLEERKET